MDKFLRLFGVAVINLFTSFFHSRRFSSFNLITKINSSVCHYQNNFYLIAKWHRRERKKEKFTWSSNIIFISKKKYFFQFHLQSSEKCRKCCSLNSRHFSTYFMIFHFARVLINWMKNVFVDGRNWKKVFIHCSFKKRYSFNYMTHKVQREKGKNIETDETDRRRKSTQYQINSQIKRNLLSIRSTSSRLYSFDESKTKKVDANLSCSITWKNVWSVAS